MGKLEACNQYQARLQQNLDVPGGDRGRAAAPQSRGRTQHRVERGGPRGAGFPKGVEVPQPPPTGALRKIDTAPYSLRP